MDSIRRLTFACEVERSTHEHEHELARRQGTLPIRAARDPRSGGLGEVDVAQAVVGCGESSMSTGWRRISTAKMLPLSVLVLAFIVIAIAHRRHLDANHARHEEHGRSTRVAPGW